MRKRLAMVATVFIVCSIIIEYNVNKKDLDIKKSEIINNQSKLLSYYIENDDGAYELTSSDKWPTDGYKFNENLSKCEQGSSLSWDNTQKAVVISSNISDKCYIYFDKMAKPKITSVSLAYAYRGQLKLNLEYESDLEIIKSFVSINGGEYYPNIINKINEFEDIDNLPACINRTFSGTIYIIDSAGNKSDIFQIPEQTVTFETTCFPAGTKIYTNVGYKNIEDINVNDLVYSYNEQKEKVELKKVIKKFVHDDTIFYEIKLKNELIKVTPFHRFYIFRDNKYVWISAKDLLLSDKLFDKNKKKIEILDISTKQYNQKVYNFEVSDNHTYFVTFQNILVHNAKEPC